LHWRKPAWGRLVPRRALNREDVCEQEKDELCGWARGKKIGRRYGFGLEADKLTSCIERIAFDVDLSHLYNHSSMIDQADKGLSVARGILAYCKGRANRSHPNPTPTNCEVADHPDRDHAAQSGRER